MTPEGFIDKSPVPQVPGDFAHVDVEADDFDPVVAVWTGDIHIGKKISERLGDMGVSVLIMDGHSSPGVSKELRAAFDEMEVAVECQPPDDPTKRPVNRPWYNDLRPGGKKSHRGKRNRSGNHW